MDQARVFPIQVDGQQTPVLLSADELLEAAEQGRLILTSPADRGAAEDADEAQAEEPEAGDEQDALAPSLWQRIAEIVSRVPQEEWASLPDDLSENHDHYIYGTPKR